MLREIAHYGALLVGALFSVVVAVFGMSLGVIASRLKQLDSDLQAEGKDLLSQISDLAKASHAEPEQVLKQASKALGKAKGRSRQLRFNRWLLSLWGALYAPSLMLLSAFVMFVFTKIGVLGDWEISIFYIAVIVTVYSLFHLAHVVELVHQAVLLPEPLSESSGELRPELDVGFVEPEYSKVKVLARRSEFPIELLFRNRGEGQAENASINVLVPDTFTHISGTMKPQSRELNPRLMLYYRRLNNPLEGKTNYEVTVGTVKTPAEPGDFTFRVILQAGNSRIVRTSLKVLVK